MGCGASNPQRYVNFIVGFIPYYISASDTEERIVRATDFVSEEYENTVIQGPLSRILRKLTKIKV